MSRSRILGLAAFLLPMIPALPAFALEPAAKIVLIAGNPSHGPGDHEFNAGVKLLAKKLADVPGVTPVVVAGGWPEDESVFDGAKALVFYMDGGSGHPAIQGDHLQKLQKLADKGVGLAFMHYGVEVPKGDAGDAFLKWIGGHYETYFSTNPHWKAEIQSLPDHPITRGVKPFALVDEWYYNIRFRPELEGVTPILVATPDDATRDTPHTSPGGPYEHIQAAKGRSEVLAWVVERPDGGRGYGFTGGHVHKNWGDPNFRKLNLNALLWVAGVDVPETGVASEVSDEELEANLDPK